jgi:heat shock protein HtpX
VRHAVTVARNLLKIWIVYLAPVAALGAAGWRLGGYHAALTFGGTAALIGALVYRFADRIVMGMVDARELAPAEAPSVHSLVDALSARAGVARPRLYVIPQGYPRALSGGRGARGGAAIALSSGLIGGASHAELEGIVAHELAHLRNRDVLLQSVLASSAAAIIELSRLSGVLERAFLFVLGPIAAAIVHAGLSPNREYEADRYAAALCDSPHGIADALLRLEQAAELVAFQASPATEPLYTANPFADEGLARFFSTHPPLGERVRRLRELDPQWREKLRAA